MLRYKERGLAVTRLGSSAMQELRSMREPIDFNQFAAELAERRAAYEAKYGPIEIPRNAGNNRTESKKALLAALAAQGAKW